MANKDLESYDVMTYKTTYMVHKGIGRVVVEYRRIVKILDVDDHGDW